MKKIKVRVPIEEYSIFDFEGNLQNVMCFVKTIYDSYKNEYDDLCIVYDSKDKYILYGYRFETDQEYSRRLKSIEKEQAMKKKIKLKEKIKSLKKAKKELSHHLQALSNIDETIESLKQKIERLHLQKNNDV